MSDEARDEIIAFTEDRLSEFTGVSKQRLRRWDRELNLVHPSIVRDLGPRSKVRLYDFSDAMELLIVDELLARRRSIHQVGRLVRFLREEGYERPLSELRYAVPKEKDSREIYIQHADGAWVGDRAPTHLVIHEVLQLDAIRARVRRAASRSEGTAGRTERVRGRKGSKLVFAGTRIPVDVVIAHLKQGLSADEIRAEFPGLSSKDIEAAQELAEAG